LHRPQSELPSILAECLMDKDGEREFARRLLSGQALLRCAVAALAVERYRQANGGWPAQLSDVVPACLDRLPEDPFVGAPVRFRLVRGGVVISCPGPDGTYKGDPPDIEWPDDGNELRFRLWDIGRRGQRSDRPTPWGQVPKRSAPRQ